MGLHAFEKEFDAAVAAMPPLPKLVLLTGNSEAPLIRMESRAVAFRAEVRNWRVQAESWIPELRSVFEKAALDDDHAALRSLIDDRMTEFRATVEALVTQIRAATIDLEQTFDEVRQHSPVKMQEPVQAAGAAVVQALDECGDAVNFVLDSFKIIEWEFDPDAKGGPVFDDPEDLIASLG